MSPTPRSGFRVKLNHVVGARPFQSFRPCRIGVEANAVFLVLDHPAQQRRRRDELAVVVVHLAPDQPAHALTKRGQGIPIDRQQVRLGRRLARLVA